MILFFIPIVNFIASLMMLMAYFNIARAFGYGFLFGLGLIFLGPICWIILGFGDAEYIM